MNSAKARGNGWSAILIGVDLDERQGLAALSETGRRIVDGVRRALPGWAEREAARILAAWGGHPAGVRREIEARARHAGERAAERIVAELDALLALDPGEQRSTPLQVVRTAYREVTAVLRDAGVPPVVRDEFDERAVPDDDYDLAPRTFADLGDDDLAPLHLAWGVAKAGVHKARRSRA